VVLTVRHICMSRMMAKNAVGMIQADQPMLLKVL
jgi:hypothetical protein